MAQTIKANWHGQTAWFETQEEAQAWLDAKDAEESEWEASMARGNA